MLVGLSFGYCVRDLIEKVVDFQDVLVIVTSTDFDITSSDSWDDIYLHYTTPFGANHIWLNIDKDSAFEMVDALWHAGKIHQPRKFGSMPHWGSTPKKHHWLETVIAPCNMTEVEQEAWNHYKFISGLSK